MNLKELVETLQTQTIRVLFKKKDGSMRDMSCTLMQDILPEIRGKSGTTKSSDALAVWDTENEGWRSFRLDSIHSIIVTEEESHAYSG